MKAECPLCKSDKAEVFVNQTNGTNYYICDSCGIHYSDVGEKDKPMTFEKWFNSADPITFFGLSRSEVMEIAYEAGQKNSIK